LTFYAANLHEVDAYVQACADENERQRAMTKKGPSLEELRARMKAKKSSVGTIQVDA